MLSLFIYSTSFNNTFNNNQGIIKVLLHVRKLWFIQLENKKIYRFYLGSDKTDDWFQVLISKAILSIAMLNCYTSCPEQWSFLLFSLPIPENKVHVECPT